MTCWAGLRLLERSSPTHFSLMREMTPLTTLKLTSASRRASRISRRTSSTSFSPRRPRLRRRLKMVSKRSESASNIEEVRLRQVPVLYGGHGEDRGRTAAAVELEQVGGHEIGRRADVAEHEPEAHTGDRAAVGHLPGPDQPLAHANEPVGVGPDRSSEVAA